MKRTIALLALTTALTVPQLASARPVTFTIDMNRYGGDGAYLALYVTDAGGAYVGSLWMAGEKSKYYEHLAGWYRATRGDARQVDGITGASVGAGRTLEITLDLQDALFDAGLGHVGRGTGGARHGRLCSRMWHLCSHRMRSGAVSRSTSPPTGRTRLPR